MFFLVISIGTDNNLALFCYCATAQKHAQEGVLRSDMPTVLTTRNKL